MAKTDFSKLTPCGGYCEDCNSFNNGECKGCLETEGKCIHMWQESKGVCKVYACCKEKAIDFCGLCGDFPCVWLKNWFDTWNKAGVNNLIRIKDEYNAL